MKVKIKSIKIVRGSTLNHKWSNPMQIVKTNKGKFIDNMPAKQFGDFKRGVHGYDWSKVLGLEIKVNIVNNSGYEWIQFIK